MRVFRAILMLLLLGIAIQLEATKRALIIGIGMYPEESGWSAISGDKDIAIVEKTLLANGFKQDNIAVLANNQATHNAIVYSIEALIQTSQRGDIVYIHFSGHGQLITDTNGDEPNGFDESWIPYDARKEYAKGIYEGENHLVDDQLNSLFHQLRTKVGQNGKIIVIADACHSGGGSRDEDEDNIRGTGNAFMLPQKAEFKSLNEAEEWVFISACRSYQFNQQCKDTKYGSLTYAIYLNRDKYGQTASEFVRTISHSIASLVKYSQTPQLDCPLKMLDEVLLPQ